MTSQLGKQTIAIRILLLISRSKSNETMKFGQLIECDEKHFSWKTIDKMWWRNYFHTQKSILIISLDQQSKFYTVCFYCMPNWGLSKYIETKLLTTPLLLIYSCFFFKKRDLELHDLSLIFCLISEQKYLPCCVFLPDQISFSGYLYFVWWWEICKYVHCHFTYWFCNAMIYIHIYIYIYIYIYNCGS